MSKNEEYINYLAEHLDKNIEYSEYLADNLENNTEYIEYIAQNIDKNIKYSEYLADNLTGHGVIETEQEKLERERGEIRDLREKKLERIFSKRVRHNTV